MNAEEISKRTMENLQMTVNELERGVLSLKVERDTLKAENSRLREALMEQVTGAEWRRENEPGRNGCDDEALARAKAALAPSAPTVEGEG